MAIPFPEERQSNFEICSRSSRKGIAILVPWSCPSFRLSVTIFSGSMHHKPANKWYKTLYSAFWSRVHASVLYRFTRPFLPSPKQYLFNEYRRFFYQASVALNPLVSLSSRLFACGGRKCGNRRTEWQNNGHTYKPSTITLAAHAHRWLTTDKLPTNCCVICGLVP